MPIFAAVKRVLKRNAMQACEWKKNKAVLKSLILLGCFGCFTPLFNPLSAQNPSTPPTNPAPVYMYSTDSPRERSRDRRDSREREPRERAPKWLRFQGELFTGYSVGIGKQTDKWVYDRVPIHLLCGLNFGGALFIGVGFGLNLWGGWSTQEALNAATASVPIYANVKFYLPARESLFKVFVGADAGGILQGRKKLGGILFGPMAGLRVRVLGRLGVNVSVCYLYEGWITDQTNAVSTIYNTRALSIRAGITF